MRDMLTLTTLLLLAAAGGCASDEGKDAGTGKTAPDGWRTVPLIQDGKVAPAWKHTGYGTFVVDGGALRTECDERGLGLLVYTKEKFGDCQLRVVYRSKDERSNAGVYIRIDDGSCPDSMSKCRRPRASRTAH